MNEGKKDLPVSPSPDYETVSYEGKVATGKLDPDTLIPEMISPADRLPSEDDLTNPEHAARQAEREQIINEIVASLDPQYRDVLTMHFGLGGHPVMTYEQIAGLLGVHISTVKTWEQLAKIQMREHPKYRRELFALAYRDSGF